MREKGETEKGKGDNRVENSAGGAKEKREIRGANRGREREIGEKMGGG